MLNLLATIARIDFHPRHAQPKAVRVALATVAAIAGSLVADALLVVIGQAAFPSTRGYVHFQFNDYAKLTVIGVVIACVAWPVVTRVSSAPRWLFFRLAILVTLVLLLPDVYILYSGQPADAVAVLVVMHLAIALVTYNLLVHLAPTGAERQARREPRPPSLITPSDHARRLRRRPGRRPRRQSAGKLARTSNVPRPGGR
jgi:hypothetical protein